MTDNRPRKLVTGAAGFIANPLVDDLQSLGHRVQRYLRFDAQVRSRYAGRRP